MKKPTPKQIRDLEKLQQILPQLDPQAARNQLFARIVPQEIPAEALLVRAQLDEINANQSPNPLADMAYTLGKCYQCGLPFPDLERERQHKLAKPGLIFLCRDCMGDIQAAQHGLEVQLTLPYAASQLCADDYLIWTEKQDQTSQTQLEKQSNTPHKPAEKGGFAEMPHLKSSK